MSQSPNTLSLCSYIMWLKNLLIEVRNYYAHFYGKGFFDLDTPDDTGNVFDYDPQQLLDLAELDDHKDIHAFELMVDTALPDFSFVYDDDQIPLFEF